MLLREKINIFGLSEMTGNCSKILLLLSIHYLNLLVSINTHILSSFRPLISSKKAKPKQ